MVRDHVVQLARDPRALLDDRLTRGDVALALRDLCAPLAVADHAPYEQHHDDRDDGERHGARAAWSRPEARGEEGHHDQRQAQREPPGGVQTASAYSAQKYATGGDDLGVPRAERIAAAHGTPVPTRVG